MYLLTEPKYELREMNEFLEVVYQSYCVDLDQEFLLFL